MKKSARFSAFCIFLALLLLLPTLLCACGGQGESTVPGTAPVTEAPGTTSAETDARTDEEQTSSPAAATDAVTTGAQTAPSDVTTAAATTAAQTTSPEVTTAAVTTAAPVVTTAPVTTAAPVVTTKPVTTAALTTKAPDTPPAAPLSMREDNFAIGTMSSKLLDSVNPGVLSLLSCCVYYDSVMKKTTKEGKKWVYSNKSTYVPQSGTFDSLVASGKVGTNCAMPQAWAFIDMGIVLNGKHLYGNSEGGLANLSTLGKYVGAVADIYSWQGTVKFKDLYNTGKVLPGDVFYAKGHTFIYLGDEKFMAAGHDGKWHSDSSAPTEDGQHAVFENWICDMKSNSDWSYTVYWQIRFKDEYVPRYYRNTQGKLVQNPAYNAATSIEYKSGTSPESATVIDMVTAGKVYDTSGKTNVLQGKTFSKSVGFNLGKMDPAACLTDGQLYYDNTTNTYTDIKISDVNARYNAAGTAGTGAEFKYLCGFYTDIGAVKTVDSFSVYGQAVGATSGAPIGDIDGFDILVSTDGNTWTVAYSVENASNQGKWTNTTEEINRNVQGNQMCHYIRADFAAPVQARYVMFALTSPRTQKEAAAGVPAYEILGSTNFFRLSELQVYEKQ